MVFYYGITINQGIVIEEELMESGLGRKEDRILFRRTDNPDKPQLELEFAPEVMDDREASVFPFFLKNEMLERNKPVLFHMANRKNKVFDIYKDALSWFTENLILITPSMRPTDLAHSLEEHPELLEFANEVMNAFNTGIKRLVIDTIALEDFFGEDEKLQGERVLADLKSNPEKRKAWVSEHEVVVLMMQNNKAVAKRLLFVHETESGEEMFTAAEESDGTRRLLDYVPAFFGAFKNDQVFFIDEIERSIHPVLIKELIKKFSENEATRGQLIFSTHESNLLDQELFRPDEIWFAEKNKNGATAIYALSDFKEHHTIDIRKGYLNGRYGGIPFLGNLKDLNWNKYAEAR